ncbi:unnamed protein product [Brassica oleracea]
MFLLSFRSEARRPALRTAKRALVVTTMTKHNRESQGREGRDDAAHRRSRWFEACTPPGKRRRRHTGGLFSRTCGEKLQSLDR